MSNKTDTLSSFRISFQTYNCRGIESLCDVSFKNNIQNIANIKVRNKIKRAYGWMHTCVSFDFNNMSLSVAMDQQVVHTEASNDLFGFDSIRVSWDSWYQYTFSETLTLLNIYTRSRNCLYLKMVQLIIILI